MQLLPRSSIIIRPDRQRQEFDPSYIQELAESIEARGLLHGVVLREVPGEGFVLVAGENRLRAIDNLENLAGSYSYNNQPVPAGMVPYVTLGQLTVLEAEEAELDENLKRRDLTWQEQADTHSRLHKLRQAQRVDEFEAAVASGATAGMDASAVAGKFPKQTVADTAREVFARSDGSYHDTVRKELIVSQHLAKPEVAKAKSLDEAFKIIKREETRAENIRLGLEVGKTFSAASHTVLQGAFASILRGQQFDASFDVILTDPPYGMGADQFGDGAGKLTGIEHHYDDSYEAWQPLMRDLAECTFRIAKPQAHAYVFCDFDRFHELKSLMQQAGWYVFRTPLIVVKQNSGRVPRPSHGPRRQYELVLYAIKGDKEVTHIYPDIIQVTADEQLSHGAQKPVALYQNLLQRSVRPGDAVVDLCAGTGTILPAAHGFQCLATAVELNPEYFAMCVKRLQSLEALAQPDIFAGI